MRSRKVEKYILDEQQRKERTDAINQKKRDILGKLSQIQMDMRLAGTYLNELTKIEDKLDGFIGRPAPWASTLHPP